MAKVENIINENIIRKVDNLGRLVIPKNLRTRFDIKENDAMEFVTFCGDDGEWYVGFKSAEVGIDPKYAKAAEVLTELGIEVPTALLDIIENGQN